MSGTENRLLNTHVSYSLARLKYYKMLRSVGRTSCRLQWLDLSVPISKARESPIFIIARFEVISKCIGNKYIEEWKLKV